MTREQRTAMARITSDIIKADNIIEESEIKDMKKLMSDYGITHQEMSEARKIRFIRLFPLHNLKGCEFFPYRQHCSLYCTILSSLHGNVAVWTHYEYI